MRLLSALRNSMDGIGFLLRHEAAFRQELLVLSMSVPAAFLLAGDTSHAITLVASIVLVMTVEALNSAIEAVCDAVSLEYDVRIKAAKDCGSLAVLLAMFVALGVWGSAAWSALAGS